jgi:coproporphyrinogen III oxidase-like Fe-S oxidoreductase
MGRRSFDRFFRRAPAEVDVEKIRQEWQALQSRVPPRCQIDERHLPMPIWARRPFTESGEQAWQHLCQDVPTMDPARAFCIYVHVPFCDSRCSFCDCYSFRLGSHREQHIDGYLDLLAQEMRLWSTLGTLSNRPVSTVHFGGGTPTFLGVEPFTRLVGLCREFFAGGPETEWALESTVSELAPEMMSCLRELGFTRLHLGVQTLQDEVREVLNRRATAAAVLSTIGDAVEMGWIVSVDLIYGLPGQTLDGLLGDIRSLHAAGINGFSLYELQLSSRNRAFIEKHGLRDRDRQVNYFLAQAASHLLHALGYRKTLFNHFADDRDTNLYFTFPERGEDCLALGTIADGYFGDYHYRHPEYAVYRRSVSGRFPGLQGGLRRSEVEESLQPLTIALLSGSVAPALFADAGNQTLLRDWQRSLLLAEDPDTGTLRLTGNGSWFVGNMISDLVGVASSGTLR